MVAAGQAATVVDFKPRRPALIGGTNRGDWTMFDFWITLAALTLIAAIVAYLDRV